MILKLAQERVYAVDGIDPLADGNVFEAIAEVNGLEHQFVLEQPAAPNPGTSIS